MESEIIDNLKEKIDILSLKKIIDENKNYINNHKNIDDVAFDNIV